MSSPSPSASPTLTRSPVLTQCDSMSDEEESSCESLGGSCIFHGAHCVGTYMGNRCGDSCGCCVAFDGTTAPAPVPAPSAPELPPTAAPTLTSFPTINATAASIAGVCSSLPRVDAESRHLGVGQVHRQGREGSVFTHHEPALYGRLLPRDLAPPRPRCGVCASSRGRRQGRRDLRRRHRAGQAREETSSTIRRTSRRGTGAQVDGHVRLHRVCGAHLASTLDVDVSTRRPAV